MSGKYKIGGKNGKGKEYLLYSNKLLFEEAYLNGKEKEKENYKLLFEGQYLNGKKNGKGKEYNYHGELKFEGEYLNGKKMEKEKNIIMMVN